MKNSRIYPIACFSLFLLLMSSTICLGRVWRGRAGNEIAIASHFQRNGQYVVLQNSDAKIVKVIKYTDISVANRLHVDSKNIDVEPVHRERDDVKKTLLVGVNQYENQRFFGRLSFCVADMEGLNERLRAGGYKSQDIRLLVTGEEIADQPTKQTIEKALDVLLSDTKESDTIIVALSGHGVQIDGKSYFCPQDAAPNKPKETLVAIDWIYGRLATCKAEYKLLLVDACRNDMTRAANMTGNFADSFPSPPEGIVALLSCSSGQRSLEDSQLGHGVFFHFILEGLAGEADSTSGDNDGFVSVLELPPYVFKKVTKFAKNKNNPQNPLFRGATKDWCLVKVPPIPRVQEAIAEGDAFFGEKRYETAIDAYSNAIKLDKRSHIAYDKRGMAYYEMGNFSAAIADATTAIVYDPGDASYRFHRGRAYQFNKCLKLALEDYEKAIDLDPHYAEGYNGRGAARTAEGKITAAINDFGTALSIKPSYTYALNNRANAYIQIKQYDKAMEDLDKAISLDPQYAMAYNNRGVVYLKKGNFDQAATECTTAIRCNEKLVKAYVNRARAYRKMGEIQKALEDEIKARKLIIKSK